MTTTLTDNVSTLTLDASVRNPRSVERLVTGQATSDGDGVKLTRVLTQPLQRRLDPFLMLDAFGSDDAGGDFGSGGPSSAAPRRAMAGAGAGARNSDMDDDIPF